MAFLDRDDVHLRYTDDGDGFPVLLIAPGGMRSAIEFWDRMPWNPRTALLGSYRVIAMDQRNAGESFAPVSADDGWQTHAADQLALLDHLGIDRCHVVGMCIGGPYALGLATAGGDRVASAVLLQPIGLDDNRQAFFDMFDQWVADVRDDHPEADDATWAAYREAMFGGDFVFNASPDDVAACTTPLLVMMGNDLYHPSSVSREIARLAPDVVFVERWKDDDVLERTHDTIHEFLAEHTPGVSGER